MILVVEKIRNTLLPPPAAVICMLLLLYWALLEISVDEHANSSQFDEQVVENVGLVDEIVTLPLTPQKEEEQKIIYARSLFLQSRAPWQETREAIVAETVPAVEAATTELPVAPPREPAVPPEISLIGIIKDDRSTRALIYNEITQSEQWIAEGTQLGDWSVVTIREDDIVLRAEDEELVVTYNR